MPVSKTKKKKSPRPAGKTKEWSGHVTRTSHALALERDVFKNTSAKKMAQSLKRSAERSKEKKGTPFQSAMSMLNFYENRAGKNLTASKRSTLEKAKGELRKLFGR
jgi:hypothetical protein